MKTVALATWIFVLGGSLLAQLGGKARDIGTILWLFGVFFQLALGAAYLIRRGPAVASDEASSSPKFAI